MSSFTWSDGSVREALGMRADLADVSSTFSGVSTDSRAVQQGDLYVALVGEHFDGHDFVADAFAKGARGAVVSRQVVTEPNQTLYPVDDTLVALGALASRRRDALEVPVVAITGSSGKTTTKDLTRAALGSARRVHATEGNFNNRIGMPLTLLATPDEADVVVLELGTNEPGEIRTLAAIARPDLAVVTTVGESHLEKLGSMDGVLQEKLDLLRAVAAGGSCVVGDEPTILADRARTICSDARVAGWSERADDGLRPESVEADVSGGYRFRWRGQAVTLSLPGRHSVANAMIALAIADLLGVSPSDAAQGLATAAPGAMRGEVRSVGDITLIIDCYNANPQSVRAALELLESHAPATSRVAVLGTMLELGDHAAALHEEVLRDALATGVDLIVATGLFSEAVDAVGVSADRVLCADDWRAAYPELRSRLGGGEVVLLKASRGVAMEGILPLFEDDFGTTDLVGVVEA
ncbi:MAG: UDP-N-acetylmuramoyl-tripeptide--D-alanyl-D-alanine ligase [Gemmatimonadales bacterium]|jgi:UDP-N-acetylmuramoyl-tripeptide--D-alanyl-D-alanine ligase|nr:UDP-N-acetylmuramoyl-tripeptide--D-alanyl-D-alanine ligase [Gemmatimonadales bacterium]MDG2238945.1 UDP-N-acetylmuramoyl-tripeptide--D-alanyl-D-alanine ligase [Longimicrobiales bacterium]MBT3499029.1 UDP-N-acetylmuramoyl-tripeptide--D-alanyl-D-alanine ligase [Gemmatimonadales bacterium]MBT3774613.1 UDP-N-acetylmuramoyl-tripeptide--D-alanyl-D-alanine ligase [Gemmatimonadales bacterium]MBT3958341.1 UDP-N-acetylmuramoyl-tripeptide--D-alanyl-D-alanine ligase [Gemmatimonadales bacterium]